ncbi:uracil-DNA glycosylase, family 4 [Halobacteroides halobius DSM 5150]|uniref:Type-4 uracil-DNA glycosylase n=1 Tax=Halobacteroides halobius (strain ATCC 35273 / DSM 5150 / MD-1) TaxID=748449 RepID=L0K6J1_HALHC|nr:uracil-DNA glycosylase [Halobacteroides halobius]AGB40867.1 uracil-DNA glycosylase, family 4 [Halobacteroides halobius DSM 5150]
MLFSSQSQLQLFTKQSKKGLRSIDELKDVAKECKRCQLRTNCKKVVFGSGNKKAELMLVGEGPGKTEDKRGIPFVGQAGQLLNKILEAAEIRRDKIYISNIIKCRPPGNRKPTIEEMKSCLWILAQEIRFVNPKLIVPLGSTALRGLLNPNGSITRRRGIWVEKEGKYFLPTFHPAALLHDKNKKEPTWKDFLKIKKAYNKYLKLKAEGKKV